MKPRELTRWGSGTVGNSAAAGVPRRAAGVGNSWQQCGGGRAPSGGGGREQLAKSDRSHVVL